MNIDPNTLSIILNVVSSGIYSLMAVSAKKVGGLTLTNVSQEQWGLDQAALQPLLQDAIRSIAEKVVWNEPFIKEEIIGSFLYSPEVEEIVRQVYSTKIMKGKVQGNLSAIRRIFLAQFIQYVEAYPIGKALKAAQLEEYANYLLEALVKGCDLVLANAIDSEILSAHEAQSAFRYNLLASEVEAIQKKLDFIVAQRDINIQTIRKSAKKYREQVSQRHGYITPPNFDSSRKQPIDSLYVFPNFFSPRRNREEQEQLKMNQFLSSIYRAVLLGNPGGGKSTFTHKLCHELVKDYNNRLVAGRKHLTPILVVLRNYGTDKKERNCSILEFIELEAKANYQLQSIPQGMFEYLLLSGRAIVIFDGLDELLDTSYRQEISGDVESFCNLYPSVPVLVTSREVGYEQAPLDEKRFEVFRLAPFETEQVSSYVKKWFDLAEADVAIKQRQQKVTNFLAESQGVQDLRSNPLMLALMCNIYKGENYIPQNRPDLYEKCSKMLFERWDRGRNIRVSLPFEAHINPTMKYLAYWIYVSEGSKDGVTEKALVAKAADYLCQKRFEDGDEAERAAQEFVEFCRGRAWVFTDVGTTRSGERLYKFTHQTFLEYFAAAYLARKYRTPDALLPILLPRIEKREWDVVAQLAFQMQYKDSEDDGDELLSALIMRSRVAEDEERWNLLSFAVRCLHFIVPRPKVTWEIAKECIERLIEYGCSITPDAERLNERREMNAKPWEMLLDLLSAAKENCLVIADKIEKLLVEKVMTGSDYEARSALEVSDDLQGPRSINDYDWNEISDSILNGCSGRIKILSSTYLQVFYISLYRRVDGATVNIADLIRWYGAEKLFQSCNGVTFPNTHYFSPADDLLRMPFLFEETEKIGYSLENRNRLKQIGTALFALPTPWMRFQRQGNVYWEDLIGNSRQILLEADELFGAFALIAVSLECSRLQETENPLFKRLKKIPNPFIAPMHRILVARFKHVAKSKVQGQLDACGFSPEQQAFIWRWIRKEIDLVEKTASKEHNSDEISQIDPSFR